MRRVVLTLAFLALACGQLYAKPIKEFDKLMAVVRSDIATTKSHGQKLTVIAVSRYKHKTVDEVMVVLKSEGYTIQTNSSRHYMAMVVSWEENK